MRQLNSLGQVVQVEQSSTVVTFKDLKNDQHHKQPEQQVLEPAQSEEETVEQLEEKPVVERRSGNDRRQKASKGRNRWIESRQTPDRRKGNQKPKVSFVI